MSARERDGDDDSEEERTDPESPTGLRRSIAAQSSELTDLRAKVRELTTRIEFQRSIATDALHQLGQRDSALAATGLRLSVVRKRLAFAHAANIILALIACTLIVLWWVSLHGWTV